LRALADADITPELRNIWDDDDARDFVRAHNRGNETVPTVVFGGIVKTNPDPAELIRDLLRPS
jgi:glutaredoxin